MIKVSHICFRVDDLKREYDFFKGKGFDVEWGGPRGKSNNFFIWFGADTFIEVFSIPKKFAFLAKVIRIIYGKIARDRWWKWFTAKNICVDFAIEDFNNINTNIIKKRNKIIVDIEKVKENLQKYNIIFSPTLHWKRKNNKSEYANYSYFIPVNNNLPFIVSRYEPGQKPSISNHTNGSKGISNIVLYSKEDDLGDLKKLLHEDDRIKFIEHTDTFISSIRIEGLKNSFEFCGVNIEGKQ